MDPTQGHEATSNISVMTEVDIAEALPNGDEAATSFPSSDGTVIGTHPQHQQHPHHVAAAHVQGVFVTTTPQTILTAEQLHEVGIKTTHIVIHDQTTTTIGAIQDTELKTPEAPLTPSPDTPLDTPLSACVGGKFRYNWDDSVHDAVLPVRCKNTSGELHKVKFGSGGRGRCIRVGNDWHTPSEFEASCGRASSKDWKRSIRYGGRTLQCLIEEGILQPHATSCTCAACCDDVTVTGPVRLFVPYKRRKRDSEPGTPNPKDTPPSDSMQDLSQPHSLKDLVVTLTPTSSGMMTSPVFTMNNSIAAGETIQVVTTADGTLLGTTTASNLSVENGTPLVVTSLPAGSPLTPKAMDFSEQKLWWQLEEMVNNLLNYGQQVKQVMEQLKGQSVAAREQSMLMLRTQLEKEKLDALSVSRIEANVALHRAVLEEKTEKEIAVQHALQRARAGLQANDLMGDKSEAKRCANCNREAFAECTGCHSVSYCSNFCQQKDWTTHQQDCGDANTVLVQYSSGEHSKLTTQDEDK